MTKQVTYVLYITMNDDIRMNKGLWKFPLNRIKELEFNFPHTLETLRVVSLSSSKQIQEQYAAIQYTLQPFPAQHSNFSSKENNPAQD